jgi:hypothetical protein
MSLNPKNADEFLRELSELSKKHKIALGGCGCCGSPWLYHEEGESFDKMIYRGRPHTYDDQTFTVEHIEFDYPDKDRA